MSKDIISTEQCIKEAAQKIFFKKGFDGATTRDIAEESGINRALVNYYFRSKEKLFNTIFLENIELYFAGNLNIMNQSISIKEKIIELINFDFKRHQENPDLTIFINNEIHRNYKRLLCVSPVKMQEFITLFTNQVNDAVENKEINYVDPAHLLAMISASIKFHFASKPIMMYMHQWSETDFSSFITTQKDLVIDMINTYLSVPEKSDR